MQSQANGRSILQPKLAAPGRCKWPASGRRDGHYQRLPAVLVGAARVSGCFLIDKGAFHSKPASVLIAYFGGCYWPTSTGQNFAAQSAVGNFSRPGSPSCWGGPCRSLAAVWQPASATAAVDPAEARVDYPKRNARPGLILCRPSANAQASRRFAEAEHAPP